MIAGVDEAGRGALAGPVVAAAVVLDDIRIVEGLADSKKLSPGRRSAIADSIRERAVAWAVCAVEPDEIDRINILQASLLAMARALEGLGVPPSAVLVDGKQVPPGDWPARAIIGGDAIEPAIMAASILAKVHRDQLMRDLDTQHPGYGFALHKGYPTAAHRDALRALGACPAHRRSYAPVRRCLAEAAG
ncbi:ribonuclease HII [Algiphilus sp.]|uniref:ribonuclease HII n=1 Tax=Algiphilus sp. TaxID=1872431 RepID=UPI0025C66592|nr:ribonuclease HII [Algiphilus sp.]MCK5771890.1 ribonuclease HII [Algiphilus sp.]